jgi:hypothetical protein
MDLPAPQDELSAAKPITASAERLMGFAFAQPILSDNSASHATTACAIFSRALASISAA